MTPESVKITIRQHQFTVLCSPKEEDAMRAAARAVEDKLQLVREQTKVADGERAALMAALQIAYDKTPAASPAAYPSKYTDRLLRRIDGALARTDQFLQERAPGGLNQ